VDRYLLAAAGRSWHIGGCLRCTSCLNSLDSHRSCFVRAGLIYCQADYHRSPDPTARNRVSTGIGQVSPRPLIVDNVFVSKRNQHMALTIYRDT